MEMTLAHIQICSADRNFVSIQPLLFFQKIPKYRQNFHVSRQKYFLKTTIQPRNLQFIPDICLILCLIFANPHMGIAIFPAIFLQFFDKNHYCHKI